MAGDQHGHVFSFHLNFLLICCFTVLTSLLLFIITTWATTWQTDVQDNVLLFHGQQLGGSMPYFSMFLSWPTAWGEKSYNSQQSQLSWVHGIYRLSENSVLGLGLWGTTYNLTFKLTTNFTGWHPKILLSDKHIGVVKVLILMVSHGSTLTPPPPASQLALKDWRILLPSWETWGPQCAA